MYVKISVVFLNPFLHFYRTIIKNMTNVQLHYKIYKTQFILCNFNQSDKKKKKMIKITLMIFET